MCVQYNLSPAKLTTRFEKLPNLSPPDLLAAIQAGMVYLIMRVIDGPTQSLEWNQKMAVSQSVRQVVFSLSSAQLT